MNSRNFIVTVAVAISFFTACFVWETRSALPENEGKDLSVGACHGSRSVIFPFACPYVHEDLCHTRILYDEEYSLPCGCACIIPVRHVGCTCMEGRTACAPKNGRTLVIDAEGHEEFALEKGGCGNYDIYLYKTRAMESIPYDHSDCPNGSPDEYEIPEYECIIDEAHSPIDMPCGSLLTSKAC